MKYKIITLLLLLAVGIPLGAKDAGSVINRFKSEPGAEYVGVPRFVMMMASVAGDMPEVRSVKSVQVLDMSDCSADAHSRLADELNGLADCGYDDFVRVRDNGESVRIIALSKNDYIKDMVIYCQGDGECAVVRLTGKIKPSEIDSLADRHCVKK